MSEHGQELSHGFRGEEVCSQRPPNLSALNPTVLCVILPLSTCQIAASLAIKVKSKCSLQWKGNPLNQHLGFYYDRPVVSLLAGKRVLIGKIPQDLKNSEECAQASCDHTCCVAKAQFYCFPWQQKPCILMTTAHFRTISPHCLSTAMLWILIIVNLLCCMPGRLVVILELL